MKKQASFVDFERYYFENRFPKNLWNAAAQFFYASVQENDPEILHPSANDTENSKEFFEEMCAMLSDRGKISR